MITTEQFSLFSSSVANASSILVIFPRMATLDQVAAATALSLGIQTLGKQVSLLSPSPMEQPAIIGLEAASHQMGNKNLQISFPYQEEMVDKVSYHIDDQQQKFYLIIQPRKSAQPIDAHAVEFAYTGTDADMIVLVGVNNLEDLEQLYVGFEETYSLASTFSLHTHETPFGNTKLNTTGLASFSEAVLQLLESSGIQVGEDVATNLLTGIDSATDSFRSLAATADTFEVASRLLRAGGRRVARTRASTHSVNVEQQTTQKPGKKSPRIQQLARVDGDVPSR